MNLGGHFIILTVDLFCTLFETGVFPLVCMTTWRLKQLTRKPETRLQNPETPGQTRRVGNPTHSVTYTQDMNNIKQQKNYGEIKTHLQI